MKGYFMSKFVKMVLIFFCLVCLLAGGLLAWAAFLPPPGVPILEYHMVDEYDTEDAYLYNVPPDEFAAQLDYLQAEGYTTISLLDYLRAAKGKQALPDKPVILTFDDGYADNYTTALPMLEARGMKATVFMVTNDIGQEDYLTWSQLRDMQERGIEIGSHTANHVPLTELSLPESQEELRLSKLLLEWNGILTVYTFSYPNGKYNKDILLLLADDEYLAAVTGDCGLNTFATDPYLLQRINIPHPKAGLWEFRIRLWKAAIWTRLGLGQHIKTEEVK